MRWVDQASIRPMRCAVLPYVGNGGGNAFIDTGMELDGFDNHVYISDVAAEAIAREMLGWVPPGELRGAQVEIERLNARVSELEDELAEADKFAESARYTLEKFGTQVRKKPGRPKKKEEEVTA